ncbi:hypothetical protein SAMN04515647_2123 [Cohaesibacter sp. ES.047]|uniref:hypothetical protein n=1 Tax=Cohaesibacter sp. ES.047 TaxID=1798205 RepID=UPI000BB84973|nr:hypothetical protein [Cohaesibacter sp. ES.047]SNY91880.1 hypothetical protein SAMN04515647_2123 [Cohaesibacter sp. ES.047]
MKTFFLGLGFCSFVSIAIASVYFYEASPAYSLPQPRVSALEQKLATRLKTDLTRSRLAQNSVQVKNCQITFRKQTRYGCQSENEHTYSETRIDLREIANIDYFETANPKSEYGSWLTFEFSDNLQSRMKSANQKMWKFLGNGKGIYESLWAEHVNAAEKRILKNMAIDKLGSYAVTNECGSNARRMHVPDAKHTLLLKDRDRETANKLQAYFEYCSSS